MEYIFGRAPRLFSVSFEYSATRERTHARALASVKIHRAITAPHDNSRECFPISHNQTFGLPRFGNDN